MGKYLNTSDSPQISFVVLNDTDLKYVGKMEKEKSHDYKGRINEWSSTSIKFI